MLDDLTDDMFSAQAVDRLSLDATHLTDQDVAFGKPDRASINFRYEFIIVDGRRYDILAVEKPPLIAFLER